MLISRILVPANDAASSGLSGITMSRLGRFVAIAGKNGAGKSRLLNIVESCLKAYSQKISQGNIWMNQHSQFSQALKTEPGSPHAKNWASKIREIEDEILAAGQITCYDGQAPKALRFVPKKLELADPLDQSQKQVERAHNQAKSAEIDSFGESSLSYVQHVQDLWWNTSHQAFVGSENEKESAKENYESLCSLIEKLLGANLTRLATGATAIFNKSLAEAGLSDGQKVILQLIAAIHAKRSSLDNTVFILDELENHLHPSVTIDILERLADVAPKSQIWIATHSIPLLAYITSVDPMALWYMENGTISHAGRHPEKVLSSLLGEDDRIGQLSNFTGLPAQLAALNYAVESLLPPLTLTGGTGDPQVNQIAKVVSNKFGQSVPVVLDFGAGKGRLLEGIVANRADGCINVPIDYLALDNSTKDRQQCISVIAEHFTDAEQRHFSTTDNFFERRDDKSVDVIVMCNVLHEIPPGDWIPLFSKTTSFFQRALQDNGYLLVVEDQRIPVGEKAHEYGFLVMDTAQLKTLFSITKTDIDNDLFISDDYRNDGRLKAHLISKQLLARLTSETRTKAIDQLQNVCLEQINKLRSQKPSYTNGQLHGFWTQQFANAHMYLLQNT
jgi:ABC-type cobalamin/Fe3+-siderophores transport system ATPase subunit